MSEKMLSLNTQSHPDRGAFLRLVILCLYISAFAAAIGLIFLVIFFSGVGIFGTLNDIMVVVQYLAMIPVLTMMHRIIPSNQRIEWIGFAGLGAVILLQSFLVLGILPFQIQILMVIPAFFIVTYWFAVTEKMGRKDPRIPKGRGKAILAGLVFGYPFWAFEFQRRLREYQRSNMADEERF